MSLLTSTPITTLAFQNHSGKVLCIPGPLLDSALFGRGGTKLGHTTTPVHLTDTCRWRLYDSFDAHSLWRINNTYCRYQILMDHVCLLQSYQSSTSLGTSCSVTNTMLVWDIGASIGLTPFCSDFIDYLSLDGVSIKDILCTNSVLRMGTIRKNLLFALSF